MTLDELTSDLLARDDCMCRGAGFVLIVGQRVPCPDCGDV